MTGLLRVGKLSTRNYFSEMKSPSIPESWKFLDVSSVNIEREDCSSSSTTFLGASSVNHRISPTRKGRLLFGEVVYKSMKLTGVILVSLLPFCIANSNTHTNANDVLQRVRDTDAKFKQHGGTLHILSDYDRVLGDLKEAASSENDGDNEEILNVMNRVLFKHGLINMSLGRERLAMSDFQECIETRGGNGSEGNFVVNGSCLEKFSELCLKFGDFAKVTKEVEYIERSGLGRFFKKGLIEKVVRDTEFYEHGIINIEKAVQNDDWKKCAQQSEYLLSIGSRDDTLIRRKIHCILKEDIDIDQKMKKISEDYNRLVNYEVSKVDLDDYVKLADFELFGISNNFNSATERIIRNCLKIDNDFKDCKNLNRVNLKLKHLMSLIKEISIYHSFIYNDSEEQVNEERIEDVSISKEKWKDVLGLLFDKTKKIDCDKKLLDRRAFSGMGIECSEYGNNFELIIDMYMKTFVKDGFAEEELLESQFLKDILKLAKEGYFESKEYKRFRGQSSIWSNETIKKALKKMEKVDDVVDIAREIDKCVKKHDVQGAKNALERASKNMKLSPVLKERAERIRMQDHEAQERRRQQQYQQQRQQQQYQYQQQQQQKFQEPKDGKDYYKVLGVKRDASEDEIKKAYREQMRANHPDKLKNQNRNQSQGSGEEVGEEELEERVAEINNAYEVLGDTEQRAAYDESLNMNGRHHQGQRRGPGQGQRQGQGQQFQYRGPQGKGQGQQFRFANGFGFPDGFRFQF